jgi:hypothetical protein
LAMSSAGVQSKGSRKTPLEVETILLALPNYRSIKTGYGDSFGGESY